MCLNTFIFSVFSYIPESKVNTIIKDVIDHFPPTAIRKCILKKKRVTLCIYPSSILCKNFEDKFNFFFLSLHFLKTFIFGEIFWNEKLRKKDKVWFTSTCIYTFIFKRGTFFHRGKLSLVFSGFWDKVGVWYARNVMGHIFILYFNIVFFF